MSIEVARAQRPLRPRTASPDVPRFSSAVATASIEVIDGRTGPGSLYRLARPAVWNGDLVIYAHGYVSPNVPVALPAEGDGFISMFGAQGFAVAFSSFSENGWAVKARSARISCSTSSPGCSGRRTACISAARRWAG